MNLKNIKIQGLFDLFNYTIELNQENNLTIITGFNGYGKTTVLNIIYNLFSLRFFYFQKLVFSEITVNFENGYRLDIKKSIDSNNKSEAPKIIQYIDKVFIEEQSLNFKISFFLYDNENTNIGTYEYTGAKGEGIGNQIQRHVPFLSKISPELWIDDRSGRILGLDDLLNEFSTRIPSDLLNNLKNHGLNNEKLLKVFDSFNVYLIKEQRLIRQSTNPKRVNERELSYVNTIQEFAKELSELIKNKQVESLRITQELDSSFLKRVLGYPKTSLMEDEFTEKANLLKNKYEKLKKFSLAATSLDLPSYKSNEDSRMLAVYLNDSEEKTSIFDDLLNRIELFTDILNQKRFAFKSIQIDNNNGFAFKTNQNKTLSLTELSSGEQHEVVLLYELLFKVQPNTLVLIDEPEISLHVSWQQEFIDDLIKIAKMQKIRFIIATHSPTIINNRFDLTVDLFELSKN